MLANRLRHRVTFEGELLEQDSETGEMARHWEIAIANDVELYDVPAECLTGAGKESGRDGSKYADSSLRVNLRWFPGLRNEWRIIWQERIYEIIGFETDATDRREYRIFCRNGLEFVDGTGDEALEIFDNTFG